MRVWEYLDFFAPLLRHRRPRAGGRSIGDLLELVDLADKRDAYVQALSAGHAAAAVPGPRAGPRSAGAAARRAGVRASTRGPGSSCASCCASCARWARPSSSAATSSPSWRSCAPGRHHRPRPGAGQRPRRRTSSAGCDAAPCSASTSWVTTTRSVGARAFLAAEPERRRPSSDAAGRTLELGVPGDDAGRGRAAAQDRGGRASAWPSFAPAASDLEELFLQITAADDAGHDASRRRSEQRRRHDSEAITHRRTHAGAGSPRPVGTSAASWSGITRGQRTRSCAAGCAAGGRSWSLTIYLLLLAAFAFGIYAYLKQQADLDRRAAAGNSDGLVPAVPAAASPRVRALGGHRPRHLQRAAARRDAAGAGPRAGVHDRRDLARAREADARPAGHHAAVHAGHGHRQAVLGARLRVPADPRLDPADGLVFVFGGVGPEDLLRAYVLLFALAFGMGAIGLFISALVKRTQTATVLTFVVVLVLTHRHRRGPSSSGASLATATTRSSTGLADHPAPNRRPRRSCGSTRSSPTWT